MENGELKKGSVPTPGSRTENSQIQTNSQISTFNSQLVDACAAAIYELKASRVLIAALETENTSLKSRLDTEKRTNALMAELNETRKNETDALRAALAAKNETIAAKVASIASQDKLIEVLKKKKSSPWRRLGDILIGAAVFAILK